MIDHSRCAVCGARVEAVHLNLGNANPFLRTVVTMRRCSADASHAYGTRGVRR